MSPAAIRTLLLGVAVLTAVSLGVWGVVVGLFVRTPEQVRAATLAAGICWSAALPGLALFSLRGDADWGLMAAGVAMVLRLMACLAVSAVFIATRHPLLKAGLAEMMVVFYLAMVAAETGIFVGLAGRWSSPAGKGSHKADGVNSHSSMQD